MVKCVANWNGEDQLMMFHLIFTFSPNNALPAPIIDFETSNWLVGEKQSLSCHIRVQKDGASYFK